MLMMLSPFGKTKRWAMLPEVTPGTSSSGSRRSANAVLDRLEWQLAELRASLDKCAAAHAVMVRELAIS